MVSEAAFHTRRKFVGGFCRLMTLSGQKIIPSECPAGKDGSGRESDKRMNNMRGAFRQADREAWITLGLYVFFFLWWTIFAFGFGSGDPEEYHYVFGLPAWFFYSCVLGYPVMTFILWVVVRRFFADIPLDEDEKRKEDEEKR